MRRQRGKKSSNEPGNASEEEAPDAGEQQPAEPQPDTTDIRDTQQQLQSHINQLQTDVNGMKSDMNGMKSDMATIKSLLQSLTNTQRLPSHRETQPTTTPTRVKSTQPTDIEETKEQPKEPAGSGQEEELDRLMDDKNTVTQQSAEIRRRRSTMIPEAVQQLIDNVQPYVVKTRKLTMVYKELTLAPTQPMRTVDDIVYRVLRGTQNGEDLTPYSHRRIAKPEAKDTNAVFDTTHNEVLNIFKTQINRCWKPGTKQCNFLDRYTMTQCITEALNEHITNPLFMGQVLLEAISTAPETKELWKRTSYNFKRPGSTRFSDGEGKPFHILDLYQLACQQRQGSNTAVQIAAKRFQNYEQRTTDARTYVRNKMDRLRALFALYNATDSLTRENGIITATIETALDNIREKAAEALEVAMTHDLESENPTLNWECLAQHTYGSLKTRLQQLDGTIIVMAENVDRKTEEATSLRKQEERYNSKQSEQQQQIRNRKRNGRSDKKGNEEARNSSSLPDTTKQCTHTRCKRKRLPPHNAGQLDECWFLCGLQLQGIDCPNKGINDYNGRHLYRDTCRQAWKQQRQDSSTGKRHKSPKNGSDNTPTITNMAAIKTPNPSTGRNTTSRGITIPSGATMEAETSIGEMMAALQEIETRNNENRPTMTKKQIREAQNQDPLCDSIKKAILAGTTTANKHDHYARRCDIQDGILKIRDILKQREESRWVIVAPEAIRNTIIDAFHNHPLGHRGIAQTALAIRSAWWWPNQIGDVKNRLSDGCDICTIAKNRGNPHKQGTMSSIQPIHPAQLLAIDIYAVADTEGPPSDYPYALTGVYGFSRYPFIVPIKTKNTEEIVQELEWIFASHGVPNILMHDRGKEFEAEVKLLCESLGVTELKTAPKSPHSNGNVERLHRELEAELVRFRAATKTQSPLVWTRYVPAILIKLRSTINKSTKFSPYELMGAKSPILTGTVPELDDTQYDFTTEFGTDQQWENWIKRLQEKRAVALTNDIESRDRRVEEMNSNRPATAFQVGDWVRIAMQNRNKTSAQVSEPYQVIEVPEEGQTYRVQNPRNGRTRPVGITEMTKTTAPTTAQVNTTAAGQHQNIPVALAKISNGDTTTYEVIEYSSNAKAAQKFKQYKNTRPHSQASMAKWVKTSVTISNPKVIDEFHLTWNPTSKTYVIPRVVRQRNRSITAIQGRKAPAQNTGGNP